MTTPLEIQFYPSDISYKVVHERLRIFLYGRTVGGDKICVVDEGFVPSFLVWVKDEHKVSSYADQIRSLTISERGVSHSALKVEIQKKRWQGREREIICVSATTPQVLSLFRKRIIDFGPSIELLEADVSIVKRYCLEKRISCGLLTHAAVTLSPERQRVPVFITSSLSQVGLLKVARLRTLVLLLCTEKVPLPFALYSDQPIIMATLVGEGVERVITYRGAPSSHCEVVQSEAELIVRVVNIINHYNPDVIVGWHSEEGDLAYLLQRARKYRIRLDIGMDYSVPLHRLRGGSSVKITGIVHFDLLSFLSRHGSLVGLSSLSMLSEWLSITCNTTVEPMVWHLKHLVSSEVSSDIAVAQKVHICRCISTVFDHLFSTLSELAERAHLWYGDLPRQSAELVAEWFVYFEKKGAGEIVYSKPTTLEIRRRRYSHHHTNVFLDATPGRYHNIAIQSLGIQSSSFVQHYNIDPTTINCLCCVGRRMVPHPQKPRYWICQEQKGFFPLLLEQLFVRLNRLQELAKNDGVIEVRIRVISYLLAQIPRLFSKENSRFYSVECHEAIFMYLSQYCQALFGEAVKHDLVPLYADTSYLLLCGETDATPLMEETLEKMTGRKVPTSLERYPCAVIVGTHQQMVGKPFALLGSNGAMILLGFRSWYGKYAWCAREAQQYIVRKILSQADQLVIREYVAGVIDRIVKKEYPLADFVITTTLQKPLSQYSAHLPYVAVARAVYRGGFVVVPGQNISYVVVEGGGTISEKSKQPSECTSVSMDAQYYVWHQLLPCVKDLLTIVGIEYHTKQVAGSFLK